MVNRVSTAEHQTADHTDPQRTPQLGANAGAQHQRQGAEQGGEGSHQDRPKTQQTGPVNRLPRRHALFAFGGQREVDHHDGVLLHDADQQNDADDGDHVQLAARQPQRQQRPDPGGGQGGEDRDRMDKAFIQHPSTIYIATTAATTSQTVLPSADWKASELPRNWVRISVGKSSDCSAARIASTASPSE